MKKTYNKNKRKKWNRSKTKKVLKKRRNKRLFNPLRQRLYIYNNNREEYILRDTIIAPDNISLLDNTEKCIAFFDEIRSDKNISKVGRRCFVETSLLNVIKVDYSTICILLAIIRDLKSKGINFRTDFPNDDKCKNWIINSGLLNFMYDSNGRPFKKSEESELFFIEKGSKKLTKEDNIRISETVKKVMEYLTGKNQHCKKLRTILLEICGNSIEWGGTKNKQWLFGIKYDGEQVIFTITDVGRGILKSLNRKFKIRLQEAFIGIGDDNILKGAFVKKYGSSSQQVNRNKGLPAIKNGYDIGLLRNLNVLTNNVILNYQDDSRSRVIKGKEFNGTLYRWVVTGESVKKFVNGNN